MPLAAGGPWWWWDHGGGKHKATTDTAGAASGRAEGVASADQVSATTHRCHHRWPAGIADATVSGGGRVASSDHP